MAVGFEFTVENEKEFQLALARLGERIGDFRIPFRLISSDFYRSQRIIFKLKSPGLYPPLGGFNPTEILPNGQTRRQAAEQAKRRRAGIVYPLLEGDNQNIKDSTTTRTHKNSIYSIGRRHLTIGTNVPYGKYHDSDGPRTILPQRKFIFIDGGDQDNSRSAGKTGRRERWINIVDTHINQLVTGGV